AITYARADRGPHTASVQCHDTRRGDARRAAGGAGGSPAQSRRPPSGRANDLGRRRRPHLPRTERGPVVRRHGPSGRCGGMTLLLRAIVAPDDAATGNALGLTTVSAV